MFLIVGLGNPEEGYDFTRHNAGFRAINSLCRNLDITLDKTKDNIEFKVLQNEKTIIAKPKTYMNLSGTPIRALVNFYKISLDKIILVHDDLDISLGTYKYKEGGASAGHNGVNDVQDKLQTIAMKRIKIGIGKSTLENVPSREWVLMPFLPNELPFLGKCIGDLTRKMTFFIKSSSKKTDVLSASYFLP